MRPLVSIITPAYNSSAFIDCAYRSLSQQTYKNWEWVITDDCSTDDSFKLLSVIARSDSRVRVFRHDLNKGAALARNNSIQMAAGEFLAFLDSDDCWLPDKLERQLAFMGVNRDFSFTAFAIMDKNGNVIPKFVDAQIQRGFTYEEMLRKSATIGCSTVILRRSAFEDIQMPNIRTGQDYALWLKLLRDGAIAHLLPEPLTLYRITPKSISRNKVKKAMRQWQIYRHLELLPFFDSVFYFVHYAWRAVFRR